MKYVALVYYQESIINAMSEQEWHDLNQECVAGVERLTQQGNFVTGLPLQPIDTATTVRVRNDDVLMSDGPFAETKETLGGYYIVNVESQEDALAWAAQCPGARYGRIEVRPVVQR